MVKTYSLYVGITFCLLFIQTNPMLPLGNHGIRPDLLLFLVLNAAVTLSVVHCACIILIIGYTFDAVSGSPVGLFISTYLLIFGTITLLRRFYNFNTWIELFALLLLCLIVKYIVLSFFLCFIYEYHYNTMLKTIFFETLFTIIMFPLVFPLIQNALNHNLTPGTVFAPKNSHGA
jgi:rod shape-determining protein MreD